MKMKCITLIRTDEEADEVNISLGEAVIGRGQLLKCIDKRISRNHGLINLSEKGDIILTSKHLNPIYYSEKMHPVVEIRSGHSVTLNNGDEFALLPDCYRFRVAILSDNETDKNHNGCINGESVIVKDRVKEEVQEAESLKIKQEIQSESEKFENAVCDSSEQCAVIHKCNRNLPAWMTNTSQDESKPGTSAAVKKERKRKDNIKNKTVSKKAKVISKNKKNNTGNSDDEDENVELQSQVSRSHQKKKPGKLDDDDDDNDKKNEMDVDSKTCGSTAVVNKTKTHELSDEEVESKNVEEQKASSSEEKKLDDAKQTDDQAINPGDQNAVANDTRQKCQYGANCYRRNPQHRTDFSHPGDADYDEGDIPECPYGLLCYRKNKQHRLEYKHTAMPQQQNNPQNKKKKNTTARKTYAQDDDDEEDDYDYDDPFLNDASSDDYQPTDSDSENSATSEGDDEEDTKRMLKEAKKFTRKKK